MATTLGRIAFDQILGGAGHGVRDYIGGFSGGMAGMQAPQRDSTLSSTPVGGGSGAGAPPLDIYGQGSPSALRDLKTNPLTEDELKGLGVAQNVIGALPFGGIMNQAIDYNLGKDVAGNPNARSANENAPDTMGGRAGFFSGHGASLSDSLKASIATSGPGKFFGMTVDPSTPGYGQIAPDGGLRGWSTMGYAPGVEVGAPMTGFGPVSATDIAPTVQPQEVYMGGGGGDGGGGWRSAGDVDAGVGADVSGADLADGGMVGLTGPMYDGMNQSPATLTQLGFADGGMVAGMGAQVQPEQIKSQVAQMVRNPQFQQVAQRAVGAAMQSGELTPEELVTLGRIAEAAMHNPQLYPQLRQFAMQNGMTPLPDAFDPRVVTVLMAAAQLMGRTQPGQVPPTDVAQMQNPNGQSNGGFLQGPGTGRSDSIGTVEESTGKPVKVANGEYVIPKHVVDAKGKEFFDKMLRQYAQLTPQE